MSSRPARVIMSIAMDVLIVCAVAVTLRIGVRFFGQCANQGWGRAVVGVTTLVVLPIGLRAVRSPYGGVFDVSAALTAAVYLVVEWVLARTRSRA